MSFSRAKRFVYKNPDVDCSPADYLLSQEFEKGCRISKSPRFQKSKNYENDTTVYSRQSFANCSRHNMGQKYCTREDTSIDSENCIQFNRNDSLRKSIRHSRKRDNTKTIKNNQNLNNNDEDMSFFDVEEFFEDDYANMIRSENPCDTKDIEDDEYAEVYNALKRIQQRKSVTAKTRTFNFEDTVLKKLNSLEKNVKCIKEDVACLPPKIRLKKLDYNYKLNKENNYQLQSLKKNRELIKNIVAKAIQNLSKNLEWKTKAMQKMNEGHILNVIGEMYTFNNKSNKQIKELCNTAAEELVQNLNSVFDTKTCKRFPESEIEHMWEELEYKCFTDKIVHDYNSGSLHNLISDYFEQTKEVTHELEGDLSDITLKCMDSQQSLEVQGLLLNEMKNEIEKLKSDLLN